MHGFLSLEANGLDEETCELLRDAGHRAKVQIVVDTEPAPDTCYPTSECGDGGTAALSRISAAADGESATEALGLGLGLLAVRELADARDGARAGNARIENVGKSQSCMVSKLPIIESEAEAARLDCELARRATVEIGSDYQQHVGRLTNELDSVSAVAATATAELAKVEREAAELRTQLEGSRVLGAQRASQLRCVYN